MTNNEESKPKIILVVEDRKNWREGFCNILRSEGFEVLEATCGSEFIDKAHMADVILLDISMPMEPLGPDIGTLGLDLLLELQQKNPSHPAIQNPIIRSQWNRQIFGEKYDQIQIVTDRWCPRDAPISELINLIKKT